MPDPRTRRSPQLTRNATRPGEEIRSKVAADQGATGFQGSISWLLPIPSRLCPLHLHTLASSRFRYSIQTPAGTRRSKRPTAPHCRSRRLSSTAFTPPPHLCAPCAVVWSVRRSRQNWPPSLCTRISGSLGGFWHRERAWVAVAVLTTTALPAAQFTSCLALPAAEFTSCLALQPQLRSDDNRDHDFCMERARGSQERCLSPGDHQPVGPRRRWHPWHH